MKIYWLCYNILKLAIQKMAIATRPKPSVHHKKRLGKHHKANKHYMKAYWPYLPLVLIIAFGFTLSNVLASPGKVLGGQTTITSSGLLSETNNKRLANGETSLSLNSQLESAAQAKANDMVSRDYWSHNTPDGKQPWTFIIAAGYTYQLAGENLAYGFDSSESVLTGWMNSPEHKANILNAGYKDVGFGIASSPNFVGTGPETVVVAMYGTKKETAAANISFTVGSKPKPSPLATQTPAPEVTEPVKPTPPEPAPNPAAPASKITEDVATPHSANTLPTTRRISRFELLADNRAAAVSTFTLTAFGIALLSIFLIRHIRYWHRTIKKGEAFVVRHVWLDIAIVTVATAVYITSRAAGVIG